MISEEIYIPRGYSTVSIINPLLEWGGGKKDDEERNTKRMFIHSVAKNINGNIGLTGIISVNVGKSIQTVCERH